MLMLAWPEKLRILGTFYDLDVKSVPPTNLPIEEWGECDDNGLSITVYVNGQVYHDLDTLLHEILHAGCSMGLRLGDSDKDEEKTVRAVARFVAQVLLDNSLVKWNDRIESEAPPPPPPSSPRRAARDWEDAYRAWEVEYEYDLGSVGWEHGEGLYFTVSKDVQEIEDTVRHEEGPEDVPMDLKILSARYLGEIRPTVRACGDRQAEEGGVSLRKEA
jgi:hypothetical protein